MNTHISSGAIVYIIESNNVSVLLLRRKSTNSWHLPKGTQNSGETLEQTAVREVKEETGLDINLGSYIGKLDSTYLRDGKQIKKHTHYFLANSIGGKLECSDKEHDEVLFIDYQTALSRLQNFSLYEEEGKILKMAEHSFV